MAIRLVFFVDKTNNVIEKTIDFEWFPGLSITQKRKSIQSLHEKIVKDLKIPAKDIMEISSKSEDENGRKLSALNLDFQYKNKVFKVENWFQSSKVFTDCGPHHDLLNIDSNLVKKELKYRSKGELIEFNLLDEVWPLEPKSLFYDLLYINALNQNKSLHDFILRYNCFTDIEFNHVKSINSQARAAAFYVSLFRKGLLMGVLKDKDYYINVMKDFEVNQNSLFTVKT